MPKRGYLNQFVIFYNSFYIQTLRKNEGILKLIMMGVSEFMQYIAYYTSHSGVELLFGRMPAWDIDFGLWIGFYMAIGCGVIGLIGGALVER
ncbi:hypothetical protein LCGC14_2014690 [marine sediment metagenome]|uniref:Uncharacterized protein n=1 Tax=marine sediment metagenome TaxID=412755 RepID=A0A0F9HWI1_9ZZZZ